MTVSQIVEFVVLGFGTGVYGTLVGAGGGFLLVPLLLITLRVQPAQAAGTSLAVVFLNALSGSISYARQGRIDYQPAIAFALATLPGAYLGAHVAGRFGGATFRWVFALLLLGIAAILLWRPTSVGDAGGGAQPASDGPRGRWRIQRTLTDRMGHVFRYQYNLLGGILASVLVGFVSSILGIGGGIIHVPMLIHLLGFPAHVATATSHFILAISAGVGAGTHAALGHVLLGPAAALGGGVVVGAQVGAALSHRVRGSLVVRILSLALVLVAARLLLT
jgi:uncharacterized membrane protein YfcA